MNIGMLLKNKFPPDIRVEKEARSLIEGGHSVFLLAEGQTNQAELEQVDQITVKRFKPLRAQQPLAHKLNELWFYLSFNERLWQRQTQQFIDEFGIEALHVHDLPLAKAALKAAQAKGIVCILDLHENFPQALQVHHSSRPQLRWLTNNLNRWTAYERWAIHQADHVIVVVDEAKARLMNDYQLNEHNITVIMNVEDADYFTTMAKDEAITTAYQEDFVVSYIGGYGLHRGLETAIRALTHLKHIPNLKLVLVGVRKAGRQHLMSLANQAGVSKQVDLVDWQPFDKVPSFLEASDVSLVPHVKNAHTDSTIPHKLFHGMLMQKPLIVSNCRPLKRIVEETQSGLVFESENPEDLADKINHMHQNPQLREQWGCNGNIAASGQYNWRHEGLKLAQLYDHISASRQH